jgi:HEAT repeat protein
MKPITILALVSGILFLAPTSVPADADIPKLIKALDDSRHAVVLGAIEKLGNQGSAAKEAVPALGKFLRKNHKEFPVQAAKALAKIGAPAVPELIKALDDPSETVRIRALLTLGTIGREARLAVIPVAKLLEDENVRIRLAAALVLGAMHEEARPAAIPLGKALRDADPQVRFVAADSLYQIGLEGIEQILPVAKDNDPDIRFNALAAIRRYVGSKKAVEALVDALSDKNMKIRGLAISGLVRFGPAAKTSLPQLLENLLTGERDVQKNAFTAIMAIGSHQDIELRDKLTGLNEKMSWGAADSPMMDFPKTVKSLMVPNPTARLTAALALGRLGPKAKNALPLLKQLQKDPNHIVRAAAVLVVPAIDNTVKRNWEAVDDYIKDAILEQKGSKDAGELVRLHILFSVIPSFVKNANEAVPAVQKSLNKSKEWSRKALDDFSFRLQDLSALLDGINYPAQWNLGFTEPFNGLVFVMQKLVHEAKNPDVPVFVFQNLGDGVPASSLYWPAIQQQWIQILPRVPLDLVIMDKKQRIATAEVMLARYEKFFKNEIVVPAISSSLMDLG